MRDWTIRLSLPGYLLWIVAWLWFGLPWYLSPMTVMAGLACWLLHLAVGPLPALDPHPGVATVTGHTTEVVDEFGGRRPVLHVRVDTRDGTFDSVLADHVEDRDRFVLGSRWSVRVFADSTARVFLSGAHDDLPRTGYDLDGVRMAQESSARRKPLARRRFRRRTRRRAG